MSIGTAAAPPADARPQPVATSPRLVDVPAPAPEGASRGVRAVRAAGAGVALAAVVVAARAGGVLEGPVAVLVAVLVVLAVPTSRLAARRVLLAGCLLLGWGHLAWWWDLPVGDVGRAVGALALLAGALGAWVAGARNPGTRVRRLVPHVAAVDLVPVAALAVSAFMLAPWLRLAQPRAALGVLMTGWDHSAHYAMTAHIRETGTVVWAGPPAASGFPWSYAHYPQGYHASVAALMELWGPTVPTATGLDVVAYGRALGLVAVVAVVVVVAGLVAVPALRRRPAVAVVVAGVVVAGFLWGPGGLVLADGFPNLFLAAALLVSIPLVAVPLGRWPAPLHLAAIAGALVGVAHSWALLLTMAAPLALVVLLPLRRRRAAAPAARWAGIGLLAVATVGAVATAVAVIRVQPLTDIVVMGGGVSGRGVTETAVVVAGALGVVAVVMPARRLRRPSRSGEGATHRLPSELVRAVGAAGGVLVGACVAGWMAWVQLGDGGLGYYFWKYGIALELLALVVGGLTVGVLVARSGTARRWTFVAGVVVVLATAVGFGAPHPLVSAALPLGDSAGLVARGRLATTSDHPTPEAERVLAAARLSREQGAPSVYVPVETRGLQDPASVAQWHAALTGRWTDDLNAPIGLLVAADVSAAAAPDLVGELLATGDDLVVVVPPEHLDAVRAGLTASLRIRVLSW